MDVDVDAITDLLADRSLRECSGRGRQLRLVPVGAVGSATQG